jgi:hypothetical protein
MKKVFIIPFLFLLISNISYSQEKIESDIDSAVQNAKKGIYWALSNIPDKKSKLEKSLINNDNLVATVKIEKELNGVRVESTGYYQTNEATIVIYRSKDSLLKDGYIKKNDIESFEDDN